MSKFPRRFYEFGEFRIDESQRVLLRQGLPVPLPPKVFDTLIALVQDSGDIVEKEELIRRIWPDTFVEENSLSQHVSILRRALGDHWAWAPLARDSSGRQMDAHCFKQLTRTMSPKSGVN